MHTYIKAIALIVVLLLVWYWYQTRSEGIQISADQVVRSLPQDILYTMTQRDFSAPEYFVTGVDGVPLRQIGDVELAQIAWTGK